MSGLPKIGILQRNNTEFGAIAEYELTDIDVLPFSGSATYTTNGNDQLTAATYYSSTTQITANRIAAQSITYTNDNPTQVVTTYYSTDDGTTVLRTATTDISYTDDVPTGMETTWT